MVATLESARLKAVTDELTSVELRSAASRVEDTSSPWRLHSIAKSASKFEDYVSKVLMAVPGETANATTRKVSIIWMELKYALKQAPAQIEKEFHASLSRIRAGLELNNSKDLQNILICQAVLHNCFAEVDRSLQETPLQ